MKKYIVIFACFLCTLSKNVFAQTTKVDGWTIQFVDERTGAGFYSGEGAVTGTLILDNKTKVPATVYAEALAFGYNELGWSSELSNIDEYELTPENGGALIQNSTARKLYAEDFPTDENGTHYAYNSSVNTASKTIFIWKEIRPEKLGGYKGTGKGLMVNVYKTKTGAEITAFKTTCGNIFFALLKKAPSKKPIVNKPKPKQEICGDGIDNDNDGEIDEDCKVEIPVEDKVEIPVEVDEDIKTFKKPTLPAQPSSCNSCLLAGLPNLDFSPTTNDAFIFNIGRGGNQVFRPRRVTGSSGPFDGNIGPGGSSGPFDGNNGTGNGGNSGGSGPFDGTGRLPGVRVIL